MIDATLLEKVVDERLTDEQKNALMAGFCPKCFPTMIDYRILDHFYSEKHSMNMLRVKCSNITSCEWEAIIPDHRSDNGLENFFNS